MKQFLLASMFIIFTTYVNANAVNMAPIISYLLSDTAPLTDEEVAIDKVKAYANDQTLPAPTVQDYIDAGVTGITAENINAMNSAVAALTAEDVDTTAEIQAVVDTVSSSTQWDASNWDELIWQ